MKRNFRRFANIATATLLAACMTAPMASGLTSSAAGTITISGADITAAHEYTLYQLFAGTVNGANIATPATVGDLSGVKWAWAPADGATDEAKAEAAAKTTAFITALNSSTLFKVSADADAAEVATAIKDYCYTAGSDGATLTANEDNIKKLAQWLGTNASLLTKVSTASAAVGAETAPSFTGVADGYYIIVESALAEGSNGSMTYHLLGTYDDSADASVSVKTSMPTVVKKVKENVKYTENEGYGEGYNDVADYTIGDDVPFRLIATLPTNIDYYSSYYIKFTDNLDAGFEKPTTYTVAIDGQDAAVITIDEAGSGKSTDENIVVTVTGDDAAGWDILVEVLDIQKYKSAATDGSLADTEVTVDYNAKLDADAVIGRPGNYNDVMLTYSNNPNNAGSGETGQTDVDGVVVFTYELDVYKYDGANEADGRLEGAQFVLSTVNAEGKTVYLVIDDTTEDYSWIEVNTEEEGFTWANSGAEIFESVKDKDITIPGLDDGTYTLTEIAAPVGYNPIPSLTLVISAETANGQDHDAIGPNADTSDPADQIGDGRNGDQLTEITLTDGATTTHDTNNDAADDEVGGTVLTDGNVQVKVQNNSGAQLPGTGGIGTTLFYLGGGAMVAIGAIYLISKKRANGAQE